ncbi:formyltransferase family protein [Teredinibacter turnerae]|uniref:formyltransferase family protein n=1 Tax=Teredinibacter turnerae TaxID=2426 RepID=UPI000361C352|nr:formyltransferase family protein [Teredinibacter turnerae]
MRILYFGDDLFINCYHVLNIENTISHVFVGSENEYTNKIMSSAKQNGATIVSGELQRGHIDKIVTESKVDLVFSAGYSRKISFAYDTVPSLNLHPTLLPEGRGPDAAAWVSLKYRDFAGFTFHKITGGYDEGDIVYQRKVNIEPNDGWEMYMAKIHIEVTRAMPDLIGNIAQYYSDAKIQPKGSSWPQITAVERYINWEMSHNQISLIIQSFGRWGAIVPLGSGFLLITHVELSKYNHGLPPGKVLSEDPYAVMVATAEGLASIPRNSVIKNIDRTIANQLGIA